MKKWMVLHSGWSYTVDGPTQWVNLVMVEKPNGDVRVCLDMREANKAIIRERQLIPTVEKTVHEMGEGEDVHKG